MARLVARQKKREPRPPQALLRRAIVYRVLTPGCRVSGNEQMIRDRTTRVNANGLKVATVKIRNEAQPRLSKLTIPVVSAYSL